MKIILLIAILILTVTESYCWSPAESKGRNTGTTPAGNLRAMTLNDFLHLSPAEYKKLTGRKMTFAQKITFAIVKAKLKHRQEETVAKKKDLGLISLLLGILSVLCMLTVAGALGALGFFAALGAFIVGLKALRQDKKDRKALIGVILGGGFLVLLIIVVLVFAAGGI